MPESLQRCPFLSYADLDDLINGKPSETYDNIAAILGLDDLNAAARRLTAAKKENDAVVSAAKDRKPLLHAALEEVGHDDRALKALVTMEEKGPDHTVLDALIAGAPTADEGRLREARLEAAAETESSDLDRVGAAVDLKVERGGKPKVHVTCDTDPVKEALDNAMALARTENCSETALRHVLPSLCREALATAIVEAAWLRRNRTGLPAEDLQAAIDATERLVPLASLALFDDGLVHPDDEVRDRLRALYGHECTTLIHQCQQGAHPSGGMYRAESIEGSTTDRPLFVAVRSGAVPPAVGTELDTWVLRHSTNATFVTADDFDRRPISPTMLERYLDAVGVVDEPTTGGAPDNARSRISELKGMATRCLKLDQHDWLDVWRVLGSPDKPSLNRLLNLSASTNHALKSGTFTAEVFRLEPAKSGWSGALATAQEILRQRLAVPAEETDPSLSRRAPLTLLNPPNRTSSPGRTRRRSPAP
ncbi:hypothetical protein ACFUN7_10575 [Streptomyces sp. NPDC057236]|uniref:hypothetical protein n=1 Tax=Streptomyces sp. NPDC057236 TaxID=3346059 RepID=UPI0036307D07